MRFADLHVHSHFSDGTFSPQDIVREAVRVGLSCVSITDHDAVDAIDPAQEVAGKDLEIVPGIELTAESGGHEVHILGYLFDYQDKALLQMLHQMREVRVKRVHEICKKLNKMNVPLLPEHVFKFAGEGSVGRLHVARALHEQGHVGSIAEAFVRYIGDKGIAYVGKFKMTPKEAIDWILRVKGVPVLAHPYTLSERSLVSDFVKMGIMGLEIFYTEHSEYQQDEFFKMAEKYGLLITGGSDCHGLAKDEVYLGRIKLPYEYVERLKEAQRALR